MSSNYDFELHWEWFNSAAWWPVFHIRLKLVTYISWPSWDFFCSCCIPAYLLPTLPEAHQGQQHWSSHLWDLSPALAGSTDGHCISPVSSRIRPAWDSNQTTSIYPYSLPVTETHIADVFSMHAISDSSTCACNLQFGVMSNLNCITGW